VSRREEPVSLALGKYLDEPAGLGEVLEAIDALADDPRPAGQGVQGTKDKHFYAERAVPRAPGPRWSLGM